MTPEKIKEALNLLLEDLNAEVGLDREAFINLLTHKVSCSDELAHGKTLVVTYCEEEDTYQTGPLGLLNGVLLRLLGCCFQVRRGLDRPVFDLYEQSMEGAESPLLATKPSLESERVIRMAHERKEFGPLEDGFFYWFPAGAGGLTSGGLRVLADELDRMNKPWEATVNSYFEGQPPDEY